VAERFADPAVPKRIEVDLPLIGYDDELLRDVALTILPTAQHQAATTLSLLQTVPGIGQSLSLGRLYASQDIPRFPRLQAFASSCRLVKCAKVSNGTRAGTSGATIGQAHLTWAFSEAAVLCLRANRPGQKCRARLEQTHDKGQALTIFAPNLARAVYSMLQRKGAFDRQRFLNG
jgi:transposase